jgi:hypothetical protein
MSNDNEILTLLLMGKHEDVTAKAEEREAAMLALGMPLPRKKRSLAEIAQLPQAVTPWELRGLTDGQVDPVENTKTSLKQAVERAREKAKKAGGNTLEFMRRLKESKGHNTLDSRSL